MLSALCPSPVSEEEAIVASSSTLKVENIQAQRPLFGSEGHGTAQIVYKAKDGSVCKGTVEFDFTQDSRVTGRTRRTVSTTTTFYYANLKVSRL